MGRKPFKKIQLEDTTIPDITKHIYVSKQNKPLQPPQPVIEPQPPPVIQPDIHPGVHLDIKKDYYSCICGSIIKNTDATINKHKTTKSHNNYINKYNYTDISWDNIKGNNIYIVY